MSILEKLHALIDPKLKDTFDKKAFDPSKDRAWVVGRLESTKTQYGATETTRGGGAKWWKLANGVVAFSPVRKDGAPLVVNGQTTLFIPSEHFVTFVDHMIEAVNAGEFDKELSSETTSGQTVKIRSPRTASAGGGKGWSPERTEKFRATIEARKAAKATGA
ncbi:hypothetical protein QP179_09960 [Sphingomonas aurantiaca]|uniref:hypothetical protein n=1 Tax=Sphingomonas aurantiaca TaxID=185949 RepID=UPI002FE0CEB4